MRERVEVFFFFFFFESSFAENEGRWPLSLLSPSLFARLSLSLSLARARKRPSSLCSRECFERPLPPKERGGERALPLSLSSPRSRTMAAKNSTMFFFPPSRDKAKTPPPPPQARECPLGKTRRLDQGRAWRFSLGAPRRRYRPRGARGREGGRERACQGLQQFQRGRVQDGTRGRANAAARKKRERKSKRRKSAPHFARVFPRLLSIFRFQGD